MFLPPSRPLGRILVLTTVTLLALVSCSDDDAPVTPSRDPECGIVPDTLDFELVAVGAVKDLTFTIRNNGGGTLEGDVTEGCDHFSIISGGGAFSLGAGELIVVTVRFEPAGEGTFECSIDLGAASCGSVHCEGVAQYGWEAVYSNSYHGWFDIWGSSASDIWAVGYDLIHFNGTDWTVTTNPSDKTLYGIWGAGPDDVYAVGRDYFTDDGVMLHYNGTSWSIVMDDVSDPGFIGIWGSSWNHIYAVGLGGNAYRYNGSSWSQFWLGGVVSHAVWGTGPNSVFVVGDTGRIQFWNGSSWSTMATPVSYALLGIWGSSASNVFVTSFSTSILRYNGSTWTETENNGTGSRMEDVWGTSATNVYCVGYGGRIMRYDGSSWTDMVSPTAQNLMGIWGTSATNIYAVGDGGVILRYAGQ